MAIALIVVDLQKDFCPGGALAVAQGDQTVPPCNALAAFCASQGALTVFSRDWHPQDHCSFAAQGGPWPPHCVAGSEGAQFHRDLALPPGALVIGKAASSGADAYSAFEGTGLAEKLRSQGVTELWVCGLATDYCVKATVLDGLKEGFAVTVAADACRAVNVNPGDGERALEEMAAAGAKISSSQELLS